MSDSITPEQRFAEWWQQKFAEVCEDEDRAFAHEGYLTGYEIGYAQGQAGMREACMKAVCPRCKDGSCDKSVFACRAEAIRTLGAPKDAELPAEAGG